MTSITVMSYIRICIFYMLFAAIYVPKAFLYPTMAYGGLVLTFLSGPAAFYQTCLLSP